MSAPETEKIQQGNKAALRSREIISAPIPPLLFRLTASAVTGAFAIHTLGIVDTYFISRLGTTPLAAASFVIPIHTIYLGMAFGISMGIGSLNSRLMGENRHNESASLLSDGLIFATLFAIFMAFIGAFVMEPLFQLLGADENTIPYIRDYLSVLLIALPPLMLVIIANSVFRSTGNIKVSASMSVLLSVLNIILDPLLIFGLGPFPELGIQGAALATLIAALITLAVSFSIMGFNERLLDFARPVLGRVRDHWKQILTIGIPSMGANMMTPLAAAIMTAMLARFGDEVVAGFGVGSRIEMLSLIVAMGLSATLPMFIGQNVGAGRNERAYTALLGCLKFVLGFQCFVYILLFLFSGSLAAMFSSNPQVIEVIEIFLMILPLSYGAHGIVILVMVSLNVLRHPRTALWLTIIRLLLLYLPLAFIGGQVWGIKGLFVGAACGNLIAGYIAFLIIRRVCREQNLSKPESELNTELR